MFFTQRFMAITRSPIVKELLDRIVPSDPDRHKATASNGVLVEMSGLEPPTPCVQGRCSPS